MFFILFLFVAAFAQAPGNTGLGGITNSLDPTAQINPVTGCYDTNKDCTDEVLVCSNEFAVNGVTLTFDNLKNCIYDKVAKNQATRCCNDYVTVGQQLDPDFQQIEQSGSWTLMPTTQPAVVPTMPGNTPSPTGDSTQCTKIYNSKDCLGWGSCEWEYWTRVCRPLAFDTSLCYGDNRDCKDELAFCIDAEKAQGRTPQIRNLEPCVLMNSQTDCCKYYTNTYLSLQGPARPNRPDRFDKDNCELYMRNSACKNQAHCRWDRSRKICEPMPGIKAPGLWYVPEMSCGYKSFKLHFRYKITTTKRNVKTTCECALFCTDYQHWVFRQDSSKCGCTNQAVEKVSRNKQGWWGSSTKHAKRRDIGAQGAGGR